MGYTILIAVLCYGTYFGGALAVKETKRHVITPIVHVFKHKKHQKQDSK